jgi:hypothetical protein
VADPKKTPGLSAESHILLCLQNGGPMSVAELALFADRAESSVRHWLGKLRSEDRRQVRICAWIEPSLGSRQWTAVYNVGVSTDAKRPKSTRAQACKKWRAKTRELQRVSRGVSQRAASPWDALLRAA